MIGRGDSYALNCVSYCPSVALFECSQALDVTPVAFCSYIGLFKSLQVFRLVRQRSAHFFLILGSFERRIESDIFFIFRATLLFVSLPALC